MKWWLGIGVVAIGLGGCELVDEEYEYVGAVEPFAAHQRAVHILVGLQANVGPDGVIAYAPRSRPATSDRETIFLEPTLEAMETQVLGLVRDGVTTVNGETVLRASLRDFARDSTASEQLTQGELRKRELVWSQSAPRGDVVRMRVTFEESIGGDAQLRVLRVIVASELAKGHASAVFAIAKLGGYTRADLDFVFSEALPLPLPRTGPGLSPPPGPADPIPLPAPPPSADRSPAPDQPDAGCSSAHPAGVALALLLSALATAMTRGRRRCDSEGSPGARLNEPRLPVVGTRAPWREPGSAGFLC